MTASARSRMSSALADAKINITAIDAICADGRHGALCWVAPRDVKKAAQILGAQ